MSLQLDSAFFKYVLAGVVMYLVRSYLEAMEEPR